MSVQTVQVGWVLLGGAQKGEGKKSHGLWERNHCGPDQGEEEKKKKKNPTEVAINGNILQEHSDALVI